MRILLTNDDGIHAEGLACLEKIAAALSDDVWVVAPEREQSGASRAVTLSEPLRVRHISEKRFAVLGTPTDCTLLGIQELIPGKRPDLVLSGVNHGQNMGEDVSMSGTVAGAIQGMALGVQAMALSQARRIRHQDHHIHFATAEAFRPGVIGQVLKAGWPSDVVININFPDLEASEVKEVEVTRQGFRDNPLIQAERRTDLRNNDYYWLGFRGQMSNPAEGTDLRAIYDGKISVTPLHIDLTHNATVHELKKALGGTPPRG
jgi:5'-nucleotidase